MLAPLFCKQGQKHPDKDCNGKCQRHDNNASAMAMTTMQVVSCCHCTATVVMALALKSFSRHLCPHLQNSGANDNNHSDRGGNHANICSQEEGNNKSKSTSTSTATTTTTTTKQQWQLLGDAFGLIFLN
jgi:hypothetical protein